MKAPHDVSQLSTEVTSRTRLEEILYAQCWEDADVLLEGLDVRPGDVCMSIASAGDNTLALLTRDPEKVIAVDLNAAQLACLEIRVAAFRALCHEEFLELMGSRASTRRLKLYQRCRSELRSQYSLALWDGLQDELTRYGVGGVGKFERYWRMFRTFILPLIHSRSEVEELLKHKSADDRKVFYEQTWNNWRWRTLVRIFGSQRVLGWLGRDPAFFAYVEESVVKSVMQRVAHAMTELSPSDNPFLHWILTGQHGTGQHGTGQHGTGQHGTGQHGTGEHGTALPLAYRPEHFDKIRDNLPRLTCRQCSAEEMATTCVATKQPIDKFNLSDIFEYMSVDNQLAALRALLSASRRGSRLLFWNMMVPRPIPDELNDRIDSLESLASDLHARDKAFFYRDLRIAEVR